MFLRLSEGRKGWKSRSRTLGDSRDASSVKDGETEEPSLLSWLILAAVEDESSQDVRLWCVN